MTDYSFAQANIADRLKNVGPTALRRLSARCAELGGINLSQGVCDLPVPEPISLAAKRAIDNEPAIYSNVAGLPELRAAIADKTRKFNGFSVDPDSEVAVTVGSTGAFSCVMFATLNPGDEVLTFSPYYKYYTTTLDMIGVSVRYVNTHPPDWRYSSEELAAAFTPRTRMVIVNTPSNPTGKVFTRPELEEIAALARKHNAWILADEIYEYITYDQPHISIASLPDAADRTITLSGGSKTYAITGWRVGYAVGPAPVIEKILVTNDMLAICAPTPMQHGLLAGMRMNDSYYRTMLDGYRIKRDLLADALRHAAFTPYVPQGAFYIMAGFEKGRYPNALAAAEQILESVGVATVPGAPFFANKEEGETQLRICFAKEMPVLEQACERLKQLPT